MYGNLEIRGARQNNLKNISLDIPKRKITVFTGVSGSGKSSLVFDTIAAESQRLINETYTAFLQGLMPHHGQPDAEALRNLQAAIIVDQHRLGGNSRSTVGTVTDTYTMLRLLYSKIGTPHLGHANVFSFNDPEGMCPECEGLGDRASIDVDQLVDHDLSLNEGAIRFPTFAVSSWFWTIIANSGFFDVDKKIRDYTEEERGLLLDGTDATVRMKVTGSAINSKYEGLLPKFKRLYLSKDAEQMAPHLRTAVQRVVTTTRCPACGGARLNAAALACRINGRSIADCTAMEVHALAKAIREIGEPTVRTLTATLATRLDNLAHIGLGYISLNRESSTLSGGESQRVKMVRHLGSSLTDITYVFDEPSVGLHPHDVHRLNELLIQLRDKGNTVLVVEHKPKVMAIADHIVDMGPGAGAEGGEVVYAGDFAGLARSDTPTGRHLGRHQQLKAAPRSPTGWISIEHANRHNLRDVSVRIPTGVLTVVTGVAGAGKTALVQGCLPRFCPDALLIDQSLPRGSKRSNPATYTGMLDLIRKVFASTNRVNAALFSANSKGACPKCGGLGVLYTDLAFLDTIASPCDACDGKRFKDEVLAYTVDGKTISDVYDMPVAEARAHFTTGSLAAKLRSVDEVGLGYLTLGQPLDTLSGGERQRLKLAAEMGRPSQVYVLDEPTSGLHMNDVDNLIRLLDGLVDGGGTVVTIEHNLDVVSHADWVIDLGPGAGNDGGTVVFEGTPAELVDHQHSTTGRYLAEHVRA